MDSRFTEIEQLTITIFMITEDKEVEVEAENAELIERNIIEVEVEALRNTNKIRKLIYGEEIIEKTTSLNECRIAVN